MRPAPRPSVVYVVRNDRDALLKIGVTTDLPRRMRELSRLRLAAQTAAVAAFSTVALVAACACFTGFMLAPLFGARMPS